MIKLVALICILVGILVAVYAYKNTGEGGAGLDRLWTTIWLYVLALLLVGGGVDYFIIRGIFA